MYKESIKYFKSVDKLFINREDDRYYLSDGHIIIKMTPGDYNEFCLKIPRLIPLENGEKAASDNKNQMCDKSKQCDIYSYFIARDSKRQAQATPLTIDIFNYPCRVFTTKTGYTVINELFYKVLREWFDSTTIGGMDCNDYYCLGEHPYDPIVIDGGDRGVIVLPVNDGGKFKSVLDTLIKLESSKVA